MEQVLERARAELFDRTLDADGHEMAPSHTWGEVFGPNAGRIGELAEGMIRKLGGNNFYNPDRKADDLEISYDTVWNVRGTDAPSAFDFSRRLEVMDKMGIRRQLIFPSFALVARWVLGSGSTPLVIADPTGSYVVQFADETAANNWLAGGTGSAFVNGTVVAGLSIP